MMSNLMEGIATGAVLLPSAAIRAGAPMDCAEADDALNDSRN